VPAKTVRPFTAIAWTGPLAVKLQTFAPGRWAEARWPTRKELRATKLLKLPISEASAKVREAARQRGTAMLAAPVSGNGKVVKAGKLSLVVSGPKDAYETALPYLEKLGQGVSYVGEGEVARLVKICHNVFLGVVIQALIEVTVLAQKGGVPRHAFLDFMNKSVLGSTFTRYKTPALVNLDFAPTFTPRLLRKDLDLDARRQECW